MDPRPAIVATRTRDVGRIIAVTGGKGGIGKSSISVALALALAEAGERVGLLDLDLWGPSDHVILGVARPAPREDGGLVPGEAAGLAFLSIASIVGDEPVLLRGEDAASAILELLAVTLWGTLDTLVVDMPPGFADVMIDAARHLSRAEHLVVTTPSALTAVTTRKTVAVLRRLRLPVLGTVVNMAGPDTGSPADPGVPADTDVPGDTGVPADTDVPATDFPHEASAPARAHESLVDAHGASVPVLGRVAFDPDYEAALGDPARLRATRLYRDVALIAAAVAGAARREA